MDSNPTRRQFIATTAAAAAGFTIVPRHVLGGPRFVAPSDKVNVAIIGVGGQGRTNTPRPVPGRRTARSSPSPTRRGVGPEHCYYGGKAGRVPVRQEVEKHYRAKTPNYTCAVYEDFRVMLEKEKAIDAVLIATPDHLHAYVTIFAMKAGKHVYCEKPLTHNIREARLVAQSREGDGRRHADGQPRPVQRGTSRDGRVAQRRGDRRVKEVHAWSGSPRRAGQVWPGEGPAEQPAGLNWDLWLGPAAEASLQPETSRRSSGGGCGTSATARCPTWRRITSIPRSTRSASTRPSTIKPSTSFFDPQVTIGANLVSYQFAARGESRAAHGVLVRRRACRPPTPLGIDPDDPRQRLGDGDNGLMVVGEKGVLTCPGWSGMPRLLPLELHFATTSGRRRRFRGSTGHHADWLQGCKGGTPPCSNFGYGARLTEFVLLGALALRTGKTIKWDADAMKATNVADAEPMLEGSYRKGWELPV